MKGIKELNELLDENPTLKNEFLNLNSFADAVKKAKELGYDVTEEELMSTDELSDDVLSMVAGGKAEPTEHSGMYMDAEAGVTNVRTNKSVRIEYGDDYAVMKNI